MNELQTISPSRFTFAPVLKRWGPLATAMVILGPGGCFAASDSFSVDPAYLRYSNSVSTTPVHFSIGGTKYVVPRNYIIRMDNFSGGAQTLVEFRVTKNDLAPRSEKTANCLDGPLTFDPDSCSRMDFTISHSNVTSDDEGFANMRDVFHSQKPEKDQWGYERYFSGASPMESVFLRKKTNDHWIYFQCNRVPDTPPERSLCIRRTAIGTGNALHYRFYEGWLPNAEQTDKQLVNLIHSFETK